MQSDAFSLGALPTPLPLGRGGESSHLQPVGERNDFKITKDYIKSSEGQTFKPHEKVSFERLFLNDGCTSLQRSLSMVTSSMFQNIREMVKLSVIGYTNNLFARNRQHERSARLEIDKRICKKGKAVGQGWAFYNAVRQFGYHAFEMVILGKYQTLPRALQGERYFIKKHRTMRSEGGYNELPGGKPSPMMFPSVIAKMRRSNEKHWSDPVWRAQQGAQSRENWADADFHQRHSDTIRRRWLDPELKAIRSQLSRRIWKRVGFRRKTSENMRQAWSCPKKRAKQSIALRKYWTNNPEKRANKAKLMRKKWKKEAYRRNFIKKSKRLQADPTFKRRHSAATRAAMASPEVQLRLKIGRVVGGIRRQRLKRLQYKKSGNEIKLRRCIRTLLAHSKRLKSLRIEYASLRR